MTLFEVTSRTDNLMNLMMRNNQKLRLLGLDGVVKVKVGARLYDSALRGLGIFK